MEPTASEYHIYRGLQTDLGYQDFGACHDDADPVRTDTEFQELDGTALVSSFTYLVSAEDSDGEEGSLGTGTSAERSNYTPCP